MCEYNSKCRETRVQSQQKKIEEFNHDRRRRCRRPMSSESHTQLDF